MSQIEPIKSYKSFVLPTFAFRRACHIVMTKAAFDVLFFHACPHLTRQLGSLGFEFFAAVDGPE